MFGAVEDRGEVGLDGRRAGDLGGDPVGQIRLDARADVTHPVGRGGRVGRVDGDDRQCGGAVVTALDGCSAGAGQLRQAPLDGGEVGRAQGARGLAEEHHGRGSLGLGQPVAQLERGRAVGADGQGVGRARRPLRLAHGAHHPHGAGQGQDDDGDGATTCG